MNSGSSSVFFRVANPLVIGQGFDAQIDSTVDSEKPAVFITWQRVTDQLVKPDELLTMEVIARGPRVEIPVNGKKVADYTDIKKNRSTGYIPLQHPNPRTQVHFRKIEIK